MEEEPKAFHHCRREHCSLCVTDVLPAPQLTTQFSEIDMSIFRHATSFINISIMFLWSSLDRPVKNPRVRPQTLEIAFFKAFPQPLSGGDDLQWGKDWPVQHGMMPSTIWSCKGRR
jgi:hypothetical protein